MFEKGKNTKKWFFWLSLILTAIVIYKLLDSFSFIINFFNNFFSLIMPFILGGIVAYLFYIPARSIEKALRSAKIKLLNKRARGISVLTVYVMAIALLIIIINFVLPAVLDSVNELINNLPSYYNKAKEFVDNLPENNGFINKETVYSTINNLQSIDFSQYFDMSSISNYIKGALGIVGVLFDIFVTIAISVYLLLERTQIKNFAHRLIKASVDEKTSNLVIKYAARSNEILFKFISSQVFDAIIVGIITAIAMSLLNVKYAILLGFLIGLLNIIPYFGAIVGVGLAILITIFTGGIEKAIWLAVVVTLLQQFDANVINPRILGSSLKISPILVIISVTLGGAYFGALGMFLAVPVVAILKIMITDYIEYRDKMKEIEKKS